MATIVATLFGVETEFAVTALGRDGRVLPIDMVIREIQARAAARPHLAGNESGIFVENGGRFYVDRGHHPEYAAPESTSPWEAVRYSFAGDRLMAQLADEVARNDSRIGTLTVRKGNVDYATGATWASHENFLHRCDPARLRPALIPHLASRIVFTGAGGYDPFTTACPRFVLSPRAMFVRRLVDSSVTREIALVDDRAQPHCTGYYRQHIMCGDANLSQLAMLLRIGTTALVVALIDADCVRDDAVRLADPLKALETIAHDVTLRTPVELACGRRLTGVQIQRHYLRRAQTYLRCLPAWAEPLCALWEDTLDRLDCGPEAVADRLDWAMKHVVHRDRSAGSPAADEIRRAELCEIDVRFGQVYPPGLFDALDQSGVLRHRVAGIDPIEPAISTPPSAGRASIRGRVIARLAARKPGISCGWDGVRDILSLKALDLSDPFVETETWHDLTARETDASLLLQRLSDVIRSPVSPATREVIREIAERFGAWGDLALPWRSGVHAMTLNNHACDLRNDGRAEEAEWLMRAALATDLAVRPPNHPKLPHRRNNLGTVLVIQGRLEEAREQVTEAWQQSCGRYDLTSARILTVRLLIALIDGESSELFLGQLKSHLAIQPLQNVADVDRFWKMVPLLDELAPRMSADDVRLLKAIVRVLNASVPGDLLETMERWREASPLPLDRPWPDMGHPGHVTRRHHT